MTDAKRTSDEREAWMEHFIGTLAVDTLELHRRLTLAGTLVDVIRGVAADHAAQAAPTLCACRICRGLRDYDAAV